MTKSLPVKKASPVLTDLVDDWANSYIKSIELPVKILKLAEDEGLTEIEIRNMIEAALLKRGLTERRIRAIMPEKLKDLRKITDKSLKNKDAALIAASSNISISELEDGDNLRKQLDSMQNVPVTTPDTILMKSEADIAAEEYQKDSQELAPTKVEIQALLNNNVLTEDQIFEWLKTKADMINIIYHETIGIEKAKRDYTSYFLNKGLKSYRHYFFEAIS